jgi:hypothetical protein
LELSHQLLDLRSPCIHVPDTAWFVPEIKDEKRIPREGKLVVTRTRDGGKSFDVLTNGLPQSHAYDIVYRHALALNLDGDCLALGSTTGGLWVNRAVNCTRLRELPLQENCDGAAAPPYARWSRAYLAAP